MMLIMRFDHDDHEVWWRLQMMSQFDTWRRRPWREKRWVAGTAWTIWTCNLMTYYVTWWYCHQIWWYCDVITGSWNSVDCWDPKVIFMISSLIQTWLSVRLKYDWIWFETWRWEGTTVDVKSWILLFPLGSPVLEPDFNLKINVKKSSRFLEFSAEISPESQSGWGWEQDWVFRKLRDIASS